MFYVVFLYDGHLSPTPTVLWLSAAYHVLRHGRTMITLVYLGISAVCGGKRKTVFVGKIKLFLIKIERKILVNCVPICLQHMRILFHQINRKLPFTDFSNKSVDKHKGRQYSVVYFLKLAATVSIFRLQPFDRPRHVYCKMSLIGGPKFKVYCLKFGSYRNAV